MRTIHYISAGPIQKVDLIRRLLKVSERLLTMETKQTCEFSLSVRFTPLSEKLKPSEK